MPSVTYKADVQEFQQLLNDLDRAADSLAKRAIYEGAKVAGAEIRRQIEGIPEDDYRILKDDDRFEYVTPREKQGLLDGLGIPKMEGDALRGWNTKIGFDGYAKGTAKTKSYPRGTPNALVARSLEIGTSVRMKYPFIRRAMNRCKNQVVEAMDKQLNADIAKIAK